MRSVVRPPDSPGFWRPTGDRIEAVVWDLGQTLTPSSMAAILDRRVILGLQEVLWDEGLRVGFRWLWVNVAWTFWSMHRLGKQEGRDFTDLEVLEALVRKLRGRRRNVEVSLMYLRERLYEDSYKVVKITDEGAEAVRRLNGLGYAQSVLTNGEYSATFVWQVLKRGCIADSMLGVTVSSEEGMRKPNRQLFLKACKQAGIRPSKAVYVGDTMEKDVAGALAVGMGAILFGKHGITDLRDVVDIVAAFNDGNGK